MIKKIWGVILALVAALAIPAIALAATSWTVTYNSAGKMVDNFNATDVRNDMQPGDTQTFVVTLNHQNAKTARWYMSNKVLQTLAGSAENNSAYSYKLSFSGPSGDAVLFDSEVVGGVDRQGLIDATDGLDEWFYLDTFANGQTGTLTLEVTMDGETEANEYFDTQALLDMIFAVEPEPENKVIRRRRVVVRTGDDTNLLPLYAAMVVSGGLFVALAGYGIVQRKKDQKEGAR